MMRGAWHGVAWCVGRFHRFGVGAAVFEGDSLCANRTSKWFGEPSLFFSPSPDSLVGLSCEKRVSVSVCSLAPATFSILSCTISNIFSRPPTYGDTSYTSTKRTTNVSDLPSRCRFPTTSLGFANELRVIQVSQPGDAILAHIYSLENATQVFTGVVAEYYDTHSIHFHPEDAFKVLVIHDQNESFRALLKCTVHEETKIVASGEYKEMVPEALLDLLCVLGDAVRDGLTSILDADWVLLSTSAWMDGSLLERMR